MPEKRGKAPAYQWFPKDAESDETYKLMTCEELGVYERLRDHQWFEGSLPPELEKLAILVGHSMSLRRLQFIWPKIAPCFPDDGTGRLANPRLERQREELAAYIATRKLAGRAGGLAKGKSSTGSTTISPQVKPTTASAPASASASSERERAAHTSSGALAGMLPRDHLRHKVCGRVCLHETQFEQFVRKLGGSESAAAHQITTWARGLLDAWDLPPLLNKPIQGNNFQWWDARWIEWQGSPTAQKVNGAGKLPDATAFQWTCPHTPHCGNRAACAIVSQRPTA